MFSLSRRSMHTIFTNNQVFEYLPAVHHEHVPSEASKSKNKVNTGNTIDLNIEQPRSPNIEQEEVYLDIITYLNF